MKFFEARRAVVPHSLPSRGAWLLLGLLIWLTSPIFGTELPPAPPQIQGVVEATPDLQVYVFHSADAPEPTWARAVVRDVLGEEVASTWVPELPFGGSKLLIPGALMDLASRGTHFTVGLEDEEGLPWGKSYAYRVVLDCPEDGVCYFRLRGGLDLADSLLASPALVAALEEAKASGAEDLLAAVTRSHPSLRGEAMTLAWDLANLEERSPMKGDCQCRFLTVVEQENSHCGDACGAVHDFTVFLNPEVDPWGGTCPEGGSGGTGSTGGGTGTGDDPVEAFTIQGFTELQVGAACWKVTPGMDSALVIKGEGWVGEEVLPSTVLGDCDRECLAGVTYSAEYNARLEARSDLGVARATEHVGFLVNGSPVFQVGAGAFSPMAGGVQIVTPSFTGSALANLGDKARLESEGEVDLTTTSGEALGRIRTSFFLGAEAQSSCTGPANVDIEVESNPIAPGSGVDINIVVGQCDG